MLSSESLQAEIRSIAVRTDAEARELMFPGSPTVRVDGEDVEPDQTHRPRLEVSPICQPERSPFGGDASTGGFKSEGEEVRLG